MLKADHLLRGCSSSQASGQRETGDIMPWAWASTAAACLLSALIYQSNYTTTFLLSGFTLPNVIPQH